MYSAINIAQYIVDQCAKHGNPISNLKLQKLLYFAWIDYFNATHSPLFRDDICAWQLGPVVPSVYYEYCSYAGNPIRETCAHAPIKPEDQRIIDSTILKHFSTSASTLVNRTHATGKPWDIIYQNGVGLRNTIPFGLIERLECET